MNTVGIRELKARLSSYIERAKNGEEIVVTDHGVEVAVIRAVSPERSVIMRLAREGAVHWTGGKPRGVEGVRIRGQAISETILEERL